jgi:hypothetical protein
MSIDETTSASKLGYAKGLTWLKKLISPFEFDSCIVESSDGYSIYKWDDYSSEEDDGSNYISSTRKLDGKWVLKQSICKKFTVENSDELSALPVFIGASAFVNNLEYGGNFKAINGGTADDLDIFSSNKSGWTWQRVANITSHLSDTNNPHQVTKSQIGLGNVDNTSDLDKPTSVAQIASIAAASATKADTDLTNVLSGSVTLGMLSDEITSLLGTGFDPDLGAGDWDPAANTPTIPGAGVSGTWYRVSTAGTASGTNADGVYLENDIVVDNGSNWVLFRFPTNNIVDGAVTFSKFDLALQILARYTQTVKNTGTTWAEFVAQADSGGSSSVVGWVTDAGGKIFTIERDGRIHSLRGKFNPGLLSNDEFLGFDGAVLGVVETQSDGSHKLIYGITANGGIKTFAGPVGDVVIDSSGAEINVGEPRVYNIQETPRKTAKTFDIYNIATGLFSRNRVSMSGVGNRKVYAPADVNHIIGYGQSNATRAGNTGISDDALTTTSHPVNLMFNDYTIGAKTDALMAPNGTGDSITYRNGTHVTGFQGLKEGLGVADDGETMMSGICNQLHELTGHKFLASIAAVGGYTMAQLSKDTFPYLNALYQATRGKALSEAEGMTFKVAACTFIQGESDSTSTTWSAEVVQLAADLNTDIKAITGQDEDILIIIEQMNRPIWTAPQNVDLQILASHQLAGGRIILSAPRYNHVMSNHYYVHSKRWRGVHIAHQLHRILFDSEEWNPVKYKSHSVDGNYLFLRFHADYGPLQFDTSYNVPSLLTHYGFEATDLTSVEIINKDMLKLACSSGWAGKLLKYARQSGLGAQKGNLCDSWDAVSLYNDAGGDPYDLRNWAMAFELQL